MPGDHIRSGGYHYLSAPSNPPPYTHTAPLQSIYPFTWNTPQLRMCWQVLWKCNWKNYLFNVNKGLPWEFPQINGPSTTSGTSSHRQRNQRQICERQHLTTKIQSSWYDIILVTQQSETRTISSVLWRRKGKLDRLFQQTPSNQTSQCQLRHIPSPHIWLK